MSSLPNPHVATDQPVTGAYIIEVGDIAAGILVRDRGSYRFFAAQRDFALLEGGTFHTPRAAQQAAERMLAAARPHR